MKKLPLFKLKTSNYKFQISEGFTLIELLVVIAIIAILAVIGIAAYRGLTSRGNDARRRSDLESISGALEANKVSTGYASLDNSQFASGTLPTPPSGNPYCVSSVTTLGSTVGNQPTLAQLISGTGCNSTGVAGVGAGGQGWTALSTSTPQANSVAWMVCTTLQDGSTIICKSSAQ